MKEFLSTIRRPQTVFFAICKREREIPRHRMLWLVPRTWYLLDTFHSKVNEYPVKLLAVPNADCMLENSFASSVASEMLIKSPDRFGDELFSQFCNPYRSTWSDCLDEFRQLKQKDQQIIINYLSYELQRHSPEGAETEEEDEILQLDRKALQDCLSLSGIKEGNPQYFYEYHWS